MKKIILSAAVMMFAFTVQAQNQNVTGVSKTTVTKIKDSDGEKKIVKEQSTKAVQNIEFQDTPGDPLNKQTKMTPTQVLSETTITNPDGSKRTVDIDRSNVYVSDSGAKYMLKLDPMGYQVMSDELKKPALLRQTSTNAYIYRGMDTTSVGYFDMKGNFVLETYNDKSDNVTTRTFILAR